MQSFTSMHLLQRYITLTDAIHAGYRIIGTALAVMDVQSRAVSGSCEGPHAAYAHQRHASAIRKSFLELSVLVHPDKNTSPGAKEVCSAKLILVPVTNCLQLPSMI